MLPTKTCSTCKETKPVESFYKRKSCKDGIDSQCKMCKLQRQKAYEQLNMQRNRIGAPSSIIYSKVCSRCKKTKPVGAFCRHLTSTCGYKSACKVCDNKRARMKYRNKMKMARSRPITVTNTTSTTSVSTSVTHYTTPVVKNEGESWLKGLLARSYSNCMSLVGLSKTAKDE